MIHPLDVFVRNRFLNDASFTKSDYVGDIELSSLNGTYSYPLSLTDNSMQ